MTIETQLQKLRRRIEHADAPVHEKRGKNRKQSIRNISDVIWFSPDREELIRRIYQEPGFHWNPDVIYRIFRCAFKRNSCMFDHEFLATIIEHAKDGFSQIVLMSNDAAVTYQAVREKMLTNPPHPWSRLPALAHQIIRRIEEMRSLYVWDTPLMLQLMKDATGDSLRTCDRLVSLYERHRNPLLYDPIADYIEKTTVEKQFYPDLDDLEAGRLFKARIIARHRNLRSTAYPATL